MTNKLKHLYVNVYIACFSYAYCFKVQLNLQLYYSSWYKYIREYAANIRRMMIFFAQKLEVTLVGPVWNQVIGNSTP